MVAYGEIKSCSLPLSGLNQPVINVSMKKILISYLSFSLKERIGITTLLLLILLFFILPFLYPLFIKPQKADPGKFEKEIALLKMKQIDSSKKFAPHSFTQNNKPDYFSASGYINKNPAAKGELFYFDPNTAGADEWKRLGLKDKTIATIQKYISKGGHFNTPDAISKIWGLHPDEVQRLMPYVQIAKKENSYTTYPEKKFDSKITDKKNFTLQVINVNNGDSNAFIALPGIGSKLSQRIINFRDKLGGFYKIEQVAETFGLPDSTFQKIKTRLALPNPEVKQININTATMEELKIHPYIRYQIANAIIQYRNQHGNFMELTDLKKIMLIPEDVYFKVLPYLKTH
jgi:competence ComEA-like helix-hairpin-helix protein